MKLVDYQNLENKKKEKNTSISKEINLNLNGVAELREVFGHFILFVFIMLIRIVCFVRKWDSHFVGKQVFLVRIYSENLMENF